MKVWIILYPLFSLIASEVAIKKAPLLEVLVKVLNGAKSKLTKEYDSYSIFPIVPLQPF